MKERRRRKRSRGQKVERSFLISYVLKWTLCINPIGSEIRTVGVKRPIQLSLWNRDRDSPILLRDQVVIQGCYIFLRFCPILTIRINRRYPTWDVLPFSSLLQDSSSLYARIWQIISVCVSPSTLLSKNEFISIEFINCRTKVFDRSSPQVLSLLLAKFCNHEEFYYYEKSDFFPCFVSKKGDLANGGCSPVRKLMSLSVTSL